MNEKFNNLVSYDPSCYEDIGGSRLVISVIDVLKKIGIHVSLESISVAASRMFPAKFSLGEYFDQPSSRYVRHCLKSAKQEGDIEGIACQGYLLTEKGKKTLNSFIEFLKPATSSSLIKGVDINLKSLNEDSYISQGLSNLALYTLLILKENDIQPTLETVTLAAFKMFPARFFLIGYPECADSLKTSDTLDKLIRQKIVKRKDPNFYLLVEPVGRLLAEKTKQELINPISPKTVKKPIKTGSTYKEGFIKETLASHAYKKYLAGNFKEVSSDGCHSSSRVKARSCGKIGATPSPPPTSRTWPALPTCCARPSGPTMSWKASPAQ